MVIKRVFSNEFIESYGFKRPSISKELIKKLGFNKIDNYYKFENVFILECYVFDVKPKNITDKVHLVIAKNKSLGFMITNDSTKYTEFIDILKKTSFHVKLSDFQKKYNTIIRVEDLFLELNKLGINDFEPNKILCN